MIPDFLIKAVIFLMLIIFGVLAYQGISQSIGTIDAFTTAVIGLIGVGITVIIALKYLKD